MENQNHAFNYAYLLKQVKARVLLAQKKAIYTANEEMLSMYWDIGKLLSESQKQIGWGNNALEKLANDLKNDYPEMKGFSVRNCQFMIQFYNEYNQQLTNTKRAVSYLNNNEIVLPVSKLGWSHNITLMQRTKDIKARYWYMIQCLIKHIDKFLVEMVAGFAFMGRQYHIEVSEKDFYIDILMYNAFMHRYLVVELKRGEFQPEYIGKLNFYCSAVDDILCREGDNPTIGLLLCQNKDQIIAESALRDVHKPIGISDYELGQALPKDIKSGLPSIEELENKLSRDLQDIDNKE